MADLRRAHLWRRRKRQIEGARQRGDERARSERFIVSIFALSCSGKIPWAHRAARAARIYKWTGKHLAKTLSGEESASQMFAPF